MVVRVLVFQLVFGTAFAIVVGLIPKYGVSALGLDSEAVGRIAAGVPLGALLGAPLLVSLLARIPRPTILRAGAALFVLATAALVPFGRDPYALSPILLAEGVAMMLVFNTASALIADLAPPSQLARLVGLHGAANMGGSALGPSLGEALAETAGWRATFAFATLVGLIALTTTVGISDSGAPVKEKNAFSSFLALPVRRLAPALLAAALLGAVYSALWTFHQPLLLERGGDRVTAYFVGLTSGALIMRVLFGNLPDRMGYARAALAFAGFYALTALATRALTPETLVLSGLGHGIAHGTFYPALAALSVTDVERDQRAMTLTTLYALFHLGGTFGGFALGAVARVYGNVHVFDAAFLLALLAMAALAPSALRSKVPRAR